MVTASVLTGERVGRYLLGRRIAVGGMAELYLARVDGPDGFRKRVVIKRILPRLGNNLQFVQMFKDEARLAARFDHPNLIQIHDLVELDGHLMLVMEFIDGADLGTIIKHYRDQGSPIPVRHAAFLVGQIAEGLHYAHELRDDDGNALNVIHRDISPENVLVTRHGGVKIVDFGIAKHDNRHSQTVAGAVKGKIAYMSPEQLLRRPIDRRSDIFSLGAVFYELLAGVQCFRGDSALQQMMAVEKAKYRPLREHRDRVPRDVLEMVEKMLSLSPDDRFDSAAHVVAKIDDLFDRFGRVRSGDIAPFIAPALSADIEVPPREERDEPWESEVVEVPEPTEVTAPGDEIDQVIALEFPEASSPETSGTAPIPVCDESKPSSRRRAWRLPGLGRGGRRTPNRAGAIVASLAILGAGVWSWARPSAVIDVRSIPPGAEVWSDGDLLGRTPLLLTGLSPGESKEIKLSLEGYRSTLSVFVADSVDSSPAVRPMLLEPEAAKGTGVVLVTSQPPGAKVRLVGRAGYELTPARFVVPAQSEQQFVATLDGYSSPELSLHVEDGGLETRRLQLMRSVAKLSLESRPPVEVFLRGRSLGRTPLKNAQIDAGPVVLELRNEQLGILKNLELDVAAGSEESRRIELGKGLVLFDVVPWGEIFEGERRIGTTPMPAQVAFEGQYTYRIEHPGRAPQVVAVDVTKGERSKVEVKFK